MLNCKHMIKAEDLPKTIMASFGPVCPWCEIERLNDLLKQMRSRAGNLAALLESAAADARNIQMPGLLASLTPEQQKSALNNRNVDV